MKGKKGFPKAPQGLNEAKSRGMRNFAIENNLIKTLRTRISETNLLEDLVNGVAQEAENGFYKNALKLVEIVKEPENNTTVNINQAVQVNKKSIDEAVNIINELR
jgi:hypothetical protein